MRPRKGKPTEQQVRDELRALGVIAGKPSCWACGRTLASLPPPDRPLLCDRCNGRYGKKSVADGDGRR